MVEQYLYVSFSKRAANKLYLDASVRYRCVFPAEFLAQQNITAHCIHISQLEQIQLSDYSHVICHRPRYNRQLKSLLKQCKIHDITVSSDWDDLLFNPNFAKYSPAYLSGQLSLKQAKNMIDNYQKALGLFNSITVSTDKLKEQVIAIRKNCAVQVAYNKLPARWASSHTLEETASLIKSRLNNKTIYYFPGTAHHAKNFQKISTMLASYLHKNPNINLNIVGGMPFDSAIFPSRQIQTKPFVIFEDLPSLIKQAWVSISPLESNIFNECKSGLKFWESGLLGVPVISNNNPDMNRFKNNGLLQSNSLEDWEVYLDRLQDQEFYKQASLDAQALSQSAVYLNNGTKNEKLQNKSLQILLAAKVGADWPLALVCPIHNQHIKAKKIIHDNAKVDETLLSNLIREASYNQQCYLESKPSRFRKLKKLINNPKLFFKDMMTNLKN